MNSHILIVEDDKDIQDFLVSFLIQHGHLVKVTDKGTKALTMIDAHNPDLVILDLQLPDIKGELVCKNIKEDYPHLPIIMLTAKNHVYDKVLGFQSGADDYVTKPFEPDELLVRIQARLREKISKEPIIQIDDLILNNEKVEVTRDGKVIILTPQEFKLLEFMMHNKNVMLSRDKILSKVWSINTDVDTRVVDVYMGYLRKKIDQDNKFEHKFIHSIRGFGYMLKTKD
jgi:two-component system, OmpR family, response regulator ArlR